MKNQNCQQIADILVDYADNKTDENDSRQVAHHLTHCPDCRKIVEALQKSLQLTEIIWQDIAEQNKNVAMPSLDKRAKQRSGILKYTAIAAGFLIAATLFLTLYDSPSPTPIAQTGNASISLREIELDIAQITQAARLLAMVDIAIQRGRITNGNDQYKYIIEKYPHTSAATKAKKQLTH